MDARNSIKRRRYRCTEACFTCKRRKEKCDGNKPCARCVGRNVHSSCDFPRRQPSTTCEDGGTYRQESFKPYEAVNPGPTNRVNQSQDPNQPPVSPTNSAATDPASLVLHLTQSIEGTIVFNGETAELSLFHDLRKVVAASIGPCGFTEKPFQIQTIELVPPGPALWLRNTDRYPLVKPSTHDAAHLIYWYKLACTCGIDLFDDCELLDGLQGWLGNQPGSTYALDAIYFLVFAVGAQTCPEDKDILANSYLDYGRYLTASYLDEDLSIVTVQAHSLIAVFMLGAARNTSAFMSLGTAIRSIYALGLYRSDATSSYGIEEMRAWEKAWKVIRVLDLNVSALLGRPPSTQELRGQMMDEKYSASNDLCDIFEKILTSIISKRVITAEVLQDINLHHCRWANRYYDGLEADGIQGEQFLQDGAPNIRLLHLKQAYYWTLILLTRPFLVESICFYTTVNANRGGDGVRALDSLSRSQEILVHACVNSAISIVNLFTVLLESQKIPKRLPLIVNSLFVSGLVLGMACFGDLHTTYTIHENLEKILALIDLFPEDASTKSHSETLRLLLDACNAYARQ